MNVLLVLDSLSLGGAESLLATFARTAPTADVRVSVVSLGPRTPQAEAMLPVLRASGVEPQVIPLRRLADPRAVRDLAKAISRSRTDVVHAHLEYAVTLAPIAARLVNRRTVCTFHHVPETLPWRESVKERIAVAVARRSAGLVFVSHASCEAFRTRYRIPQARSQVIHNGVDLTRFAPRPARAVTDLGIPEHAPAVTMVGALRKRKGQDYAVQAWPRVLERCPDARLLLVGSGPEERGLRDRAKELGVSDSVVFAGMRTDIPEVLRASSLVVLPSESEALPTTLIEAAASGLAAVAFRVGGVPEVVSHGETGFLVDTGDVEGFASSVVRLLEDDALRARMGEAARRLAEERFDAETWVRRMRAVYEAAASGHRLDRVPLV